MCHVDAPSRNLPEVMLYYEDNYSLTARIANAQRNDEILKRIIKLTEGGNGSEYVLRNDILYRNCNGDLLLVIPKAMQVDVIKKIHEKGHFGVRKVEQLLKKELWFSTTYVKKMDKINKKLYYLYSR